MSKKQKRKIEKKIQPPQDASNRNKEDLMLKCKKLSLNKDADAVRIKTSQAYQNKDAHEDNQNKQENLNKEQESSQDNKSQIEKEKTFSPITAYQFKEEISNALGDCFDIIIDMFDTYQKDAVIVYLDGLVDKDLVDRDIIRPLKDRKFDGKVETNINAAFNKISSISDAIAKVLEGNVLIYYTNSTNILSIDFKKWEKRAVDLPEAEGVTRGPKESYTENILTNVSLVRRKLQTPNLTIESMTLGRQTNTRIAIVYLKDIVNQKVLEEVKRRLRSIDVDSILETGQIEQLIEEKPFSLFSGIGLTQKPDVTAAKILEGRVAILCDGTPHCLTIPELFIETIHSSEDYYIRTPYANFIRLLRVFAIFVGVLLPAFALAILTYSQEMVPFEFFISFIQSTEGTPLPEAAELIFLAISFDLLKEAGLRMPKAIGSAITIVGALVLGDIAVSAGIVGAPSVIIIAITAVASLIVININELMTIYRYMFLILATTMGIVGLAAGLFVMLVQLLSTEVFGIPIFATFNKEELKDSFVRSSLKSFKYRPSILAKNNKRRRGNING